MRLILQVMLLASAAHVISDALPCLSLRGGLGGAAFASPQTLILPSPLLGASPPTTCRLTKWKSEEPKAKRRQVVVWAFPGGGAEDAIRFIKRGSGGRPRLVIVAESVAMALLWLLAAGKVGRVKVAFSAGSNTEVFKGKLGRAKVEFSDAAGPLLRGKDGSLTCDYLDLGYKPACLAMSLLLLPLTGSFFLTIAAVWASLALVRARPGSLSWSIWLTNLDVSAGVWKLVMESSLDTIMRNSVVGAAMAAASASQTGAVALEAGQLSSAVGFSLARATFEGDRTVFSGRATLHNNQGELDFTLRARIKGRGDALSWDYPELKISPGWPLPDFWVPVLADVGIQLPGSLTVDEAFGTPSGGLRVGGKIFLGGGGGGRGGGALPRLTPGR